MKKSILIFLSLFFIHQCQAQIAYFTMGYSANFTSVDGLNQVVKNYNTSRLWLDEEMEEFGNLDGFTMNYGGGAANVWFDMEFTARGKKKKAFGTDSFGDFGTRELKFKQNTFAMTVGGIGGSDNTVIGAGVRFEFGGEKLLSKVYYEGESEGDWEKIGDANLTARVGPAIRIMVGDGGVIGSITLYYTYSILTSNMTEQDELINNTSYGFDEAEEFDNDNHVFGISIAFGAYGGI